jgi:hypothetical protein
MNRMFLALRRSLTVGLWSVRYGLFTNGGYKRRTVERIVSSSLNV